MKNTEVPDIINNKKNKSEQYFLENGPFRKDGPKDFADGPYLAVYLIQSCTILSTSSARSRTKMPFLSRTPDSRSR